MDSTENEKQPEAALQVEEEPVDVEQDAEVAVESTVSKVSVLSNSFEPKLSIIVEEIDSPVWESATTPTLCPQESRYEKLARPKVLHLEETLDRFEKCKKDDMNERIVKIRMRLRELR